MRRRAPPLLRHALLGTMPGMASKTHSVTVIAAAALEVNRFCASTGLYATSSNDVLGVTEISVPEGRACSCVTHYSWPVLAAVDIAAGDWVKPAGDGTGRAVVGSETDACGRAIASVSAGQLVDVRLMLQFGVRGVGGGGGGGGGGGDDVTNLTLDGNGRPASKTVNGVPWAISYNPDGSEAKWSVALTGPDIEVSAAYVGGFPIVAGDGIVVGGAVQMSLAKARVFRDEVLVPAGVAAAGFRMRVPDLSFYITAGGETRYTTAVLEWDGYQLNAISNVRRETYQTASHTGASTSAVLRSLVLPGWLMGERNVCLVDIEVTGDTGAVSGTIGPIVELNGTTIISGVSGAGNAPTGVQRARVRAMSSSSQRAGVVAFSAAGGFGLTGGTGLLLGINTETTDLTFAAKIANGTDATEPSTLRYLGISLEPK